MTTNTELVSIQTPPCIGCDQTSIVMITAAQHAQLFSKNRPNIQHIFPELTPAQREVIQSGTHSACWDAMFGDGDED